MELSSVVASRLENLANTQLFFYTSALLMLLAHQVSA